MIDKHLKKTLGFWLDGEIYSERKYTEDRRWHIDVESICEDNGKYYKVYWSKSKSEYGDDEFDPKDVVQVTRKTRLEEVTYWAEV